MTEGFTLAIREGMAMSCLPWSGFLPATNWASLGLLRGGLQVSSHGNLPRVSGLRPHDGPQGSLRPVAAVFLLLPLLLPLGYHIKTWQGSLRPVATSQEVVAPPTAKLGALHSNLWPGRAPLDWSQLRCRPAILDSAHKGGVWFGRGRATVALNNGIELSLLRSQ